jgi:hypothetical protein
MAARAPAATYTPQQNGSTTFADQLLNVVLFVTMAASSVAFIEPSPHDVLMFVLLTACVTARVKFDRKLVPLLIVTLLWLVGGAFSLTSVGDDAKAIQYFGTSVYLGIACIMFACLFSDGNMQRLGILQTAYVIAALIATAAGFAGFFHAFPGAAVFTENDRISATFKDPNVYGPFLVYPALLLMLGALTRGFTFARIVPLAFILGGLFLSFSRGAWIHFGVSAIVAIAAIFIGSPNPKMRTRVVTYGIVAIFMMALVLVALSSISSVHDMLLIRAKAIQPYDVGSGGRFHLQDIAIGVILDHMNGLGPFEFYHTYGQQHNVYMQGFLVYGWFGGAMYLALVILTLTIGLPTMLLPTPWQNYLIAAYGAFVGEAVEGGVIDSDHWRHFFLIIGLVWGLSAATINWRRHQAVRMYDSAYPRMVTA